jgi:hypothetical protein
LSIETKVVYFMKKLFTIIMTLFFVIGSSTAVFADSESAQKGMDIVTPQWAYCNVPVCQDTISKI